MSEIEQTAKLALARHRAGEIESGPDQGEVHKLTDLFSSGRHVEAEALARRMIQTWPNHGFGWKVLGTVLTAQQRFSEALPLIQRTLALSPSDPETYNNLGVALRAGGRLSEAEASYRRAIELRPDFHEAYNNLGNALQALGRLAEAETAYRRALDIKPDFDKAHCNLGNILQDLGRQPEAVTNFRRAVELNPSQGPLWLSYADALLASGQAGEALHIIDTAMSRGLDLPQRAGSLRAACLLRSQAQVNPDGTLLAECREYLVGSKLSWQEKIAFLRQSGFWGNSPADWKRTLFERLIVPSIGEILLNRDFHLALNLHYLVLSTFGFEPHTQAQWAYCMGRMNPLFIAAGEAARKNLPELTFPDNASGPPIVAFIIDGATEAGPGLTFVMNTLAEFARNSASRSFTPIVYTLAGAPPPLKVKCEEWGFRLVDMNEQRSLNYHADDVLQRLIALRELSQRDRVTVAVHFSSLEGFTCLASSVGLAPVQIFWQIMFHSLSAPRFDGYISAVSLFGGQKLIGNRWWRTLPFAFPDPFPPPGSAAFRTQEEQVKRVRDSLLTRYDVILGSLHRSAKLDTDFMDALAQIMLCNPRAVFLWFDANPSAPQRVLSMMAERGISERCLFMGWVNTQVYAKVLDIHLDTFGLPAGLTMAETFSCGGAYILKYGVESSNSAFAPYLAPLVKERFETADDCAEVREIFRHLVTKENLAMLADSAEEYVAYAQRMIVDQDFRAEVGKAARKFMESYFHNSNPITCIFSKHLTEVIEESKQRARETP